MFNRRPHMFVAFVYESNNNVDEETPVTKKLSFESSEDQIQYR